MNDFANNLKKCRKLNHFSQKELGKLLGLGQTTIANYESGHRTPTLDILKEIALILDMTVDDLLGLSKNNQQKSSVKINNEKARETFIRQLGKNLLDKKEYDAMMMIESLNPNKKNLKYIFEEIMTPLMFEIGELWDKGHITISDEHYVTNVMIRIVDILSIHGMTAKRNGKKAICMSVSSEPHDLGIRMISVFLELMGFQSIYVGNNMPSQSTIELLKKEMPDILLISLTMTYHLDAASNLIKLIRQEKSLSFIPILLGGQGLKKDGQRLDDIGADGYARNIEDLSQWLNDKELIKAV